MKSTDEQHQCTSQDERSPNLTINHLPDEVLLEIFDSYRRGINYFYYQMWKIKYGWLNLTHVCRKWRAVMLASSSRLDLGIAVRYEDSERGRIKTILSSPWPIFIRFGCITRVITGNALWSLRTAVEHRDRVREITFGGGSAWFDEFFKATQFPFPVLESLRLQFEGNQPKVPDTFLRGPDLTDLQLRRLEVDYAALASISGFLSSATALTDLVLEIDTTYGTSPEISLLACLQGMPCLRSLNLFTSWNAPESPPQPSTPKSIVPLSKLTSFRYVDYRGHSVLLDAVVAGISAPCLRDVDIHTTQPPIVHLPRFLNEIEEHYHAVRVISQPVFRLSLLTQPEYIGNYEPRFSWSSERHPPDSLMQMSGALSTRLADVEELSVTFDMVCPVDRVWENSIPWRSFLQQFPSVRALRTEGANNFCIARILLQDHEGPDDHLALLPSLEKISLCKNAYGIERRFLLKAFQPFVSARQQEGRPVKVIVGQ